MRPVSMGDIEHKLESLGIADAVTPSERDHILRAVSRQETLLKRAREAVAPNADPVLLAALPEG